MCPWRDMARLFYRAYSMRLVATGGRCDIGQSDNAAVY